MTSLFFSPKSVYSHLCSVTGSSSSSFPLLSHLFSRESALFYPNYLISHFSVSKPKALHSRARGYLSDLQQARCPKESHFTICFPFSSTAFVKAATNLSLSAATGPDKVIYPRLKHLPQSRMDFLLHKFNIS